MTEIQDSDGNTIRVTSIEALNGSTDECTVEFEEGGNQLIVSVNSPNTFYSISLEISGTYTPSGSSVEYKFTGGSLSIFNEYYASGDPEYFDKSYTFTYPTSIEYRMVIV